MSAFHLNGLISINSPVFYPYVDDIKVKSSCSRYIALIVLLLVQVSQPRPNETTVYDGIAIFSRWNNDQYQETQVAVTIHRMEVFRMEFTYDSQRFVLL